MWGRWLWLSTLLWAPTTLLAAAGGTSAFRPPVGAAVPGAVSPVLGIAECTVVAALELNGALLLLLAVAVLAALSPLRFRVSAMAPAAWATSSPVVAAMVEARKLASEWEATWDSGATTSSSKTAAQACGQAVWVLGNPNNACHTLCAMH